MRIGFSTLSENPQSPSGAQGYFINLLREIGKIDNRNDYYIFVSKINRKLYDFGYPNFHLTLCGPSNEKQKWRVLAEHTLLPYLLMKHKVEVYNAPANIAPLWFRGRLVLTIKTLHHITNPEAIPRSTRLYRQLLVARSARRADVIVANSKNNADDIVKYLRIPREKIRIVYEAYDSSIFHVRSPEQVKETLESYGLTEPYILFVSSLWPYKNAEGLLRAYIFLCRDPFFRRYRLVYVGGQGSCRIEEHLREEARAAGVEERLLFTGYVPHTKLVDFYNGASVFVYPSYYETFGLTLPEAMACGVPVIASNISSIPEIAGGAALLVDPKFPEEIANAIRQVLLNPHLAQTLRKKGFQRAKDFSYKETAKQMVAVYESVR